MTSPFQTLPHFNSAEAVEVYLNSLNWSVMKLGTDRVKAVLAHLGNPQDRIKAVHVAGTNGKGSVCAMLESIWRSAGYRTGLFISPHLVSVRERIQINGLPLATEHFVLSAQMVRQAVEEVLSDDPLTYFEFLTVMAFIIFAVQDVDVAVIETGLGGRLDSTNVMTRPICTVITPIDLDHTDRLGNTIAAIASEKAGILRPDTVVVSAVQSSDAQEVISKQAELFKAPLVVSDATGLELMPLQWVEGKPIRPVRRLASGDMFELNLLGRYQAVNLGLVLTVIDQLQVELPVTDDAVQTGLKGVTWPGRLQFIPEYRLIVDGSHNAQGISALLQTLAMDFCDLKIEWGVTLLANRSPDLLKPLLSYPGTCSVQCLTSSGEPQRFHDPIRLRQCLQAEGAETVVCDEFITPVAFCVKPVTLDRIKVLTGSLYTSGDVLRSLTLQK